MNRLSFLCFFILLYSAMGMTGSDSLNYLHCTYTKDSLVKDFYWTISSNNRIQKWDDQGPTPIKNTLVMNNQKNIVWNEMGNPMGVFVLDKKTMRQSGTLLSSKNEILDRWVSECIYLEKDQFLNHK